MQIRDPSFGKKKGPFNPPRKPVSHEGKVLGREHEGGDFFKSPSFAFLYECTQETLLLEKRRVPLTLQENLFLMKEKF